MKENKFIQERTRYIADYMNNDMLKDKYNALQFLADLEQYIFSEQDKLHRRNMLCNARAKEIKELKNKLATFEMLLQAEKDLCRRLKEEL